MRDKVQSTNKMIAVPICPISIDGRTSRIQSDLSHYTRRCTLSAGLVTDMIPIATEFAWRGVADCRHCSIRESALFAKLTEEDFSHIHAPIDDRTVPAGKTLYQAGEGATGVFTVRSGLIKLSCVTADGRQRILRVHKPGDLIGLEALTTKRYDSDATAVTDAALCRIPTEVIHTLSTESPRLREALFNKWHQTVREADEWLASVNFGTARQRTAHLVLKMRNKDAPAQVTLFSREDMGAMMDLKMETASRELSALIKAGVLEPLDRVGREYRLLDEATLKSIVGAPA